MSVQKGPTCPTTTPLITSGEQKLNMFLFQRKKIQIFHIASMFLAFQPLVFAGWTNMAGWTVSMFNRTYIFFPGPILQLPTSYLSTQHTYIITLHYITLHYITLQYSTVQYSTVQYSTLHTYHTLHSLHSLHTLDYITLRYITLHTLHIHTYTHTYIHTHIHTLHIHT